MRGSSSLIILSPMPAIMALCWCGQGNVMAPITMTSAFSVNRYPHGTTHRTSLLVKNPKRRKRKDSTNESDYSLPDFDIVDPSSSTNSENQAREPKEKQASSSQNNVGEITSAMMGSSLRKETTVNDLIRDRSLESKLEFDDAVEDTSLPDLAVLPNNSESANIGKKKAKQAARMAKALKRQEEEDSNLLSKIPFILDEKGEVSAIKILESGTWLGIGLLVGWEVYINSPLFERAQPMIPVVYDLVL